MKSACLGRIGLACLAFAAAAVFCGAAPAKKPNVIVILADDLGYSDPGFQNPKTPFKTPNLDALAAEGTVFDNAYATAGVCSPSRAALLTGRYQTRFGFEVLPPTGGADYGIPPSEIMLPELMKAQGYATGMVGKWHIGSAPQQIPQDRGFDYFYGFLPAAHHYFPSGPDSKPFRPSQIMENRKENQPFDKYLTDQFGDKATEFIEAHADEPFFLYLPFNAVHTANDPAGIDRDMQATAEDKALFPSLKGTRQEMAAATYALDRAVGHVVQTLKDRGLYDNTLIIFTSDNGGRSAWGASNLPLRNGKGTLWEGGDRVPFFMVGPGVPKGQTSDALVWGPDIFATAVALAGGTQPSDRTMDGIDLLPVVAGAAGHDVLHWQFGDPTPQQFSGQAIRKGDWKLIGTGGALSLFNLENDIGEKNNLATSNPTKLLELLNDLTAWQAQQIKPLWTSQFPDAKPKGTILRPAGFTFVYQGGSGPWSGKDKWLSPTDTDERRKVFTMLATDTHPGNTLRFDTAAAGYTATNDITARGDLPQVLNALELAGTFDGSENQTATLDGKPLMFTRNVAGDRPRIVGSATAKGAATFTFNLELPILLFADLELTGDGTQVFHINGSISDYSALGQSNGLIKKGTSTFTLGGTQPNTYQGLTQVEAGTLVLDKPAGVAAVGGEVVVGTGKGQPGTAVLKVLAEGQLPAQSKVRVESDGVLHVEGDQQVGALDGHGVLELAGGTLHVRGDCDFGADGLTLRIAPRAAANGALLVVEGHLRGAEELAAALPAGFRLEQTAQRVQLVRDTALALSEAARH